MKLVLYDDWKLGVVNDNGRVVDAEAALSGHHFHKPQDKIETVINEWDSLKSKIEEATNGKDGVAADSVKFRPPVPRPSKLICAAVNYLEFGQREPAVLDAFLKSPSAIIGSGDTCVLPDVPASIFHHEAELAFVVGEDSQQRQSGRCLLPYLWLYELLGHVGSRSSRCCWQQLLAGQVVGHLRAHGARTGDLRRDSRPAKHPSAPL